MAVTHGAGDGTLSSPDLPTEATASATEATGSNETVPVTGVSPASLYEVHGLTRTVRDGRRDRTILDDVSFCVRRGEILGLSGDSGAGKTTLLSLLGGLDRPTGGWMVFDGREVVFPPPPARSRLLGSAATTAQAFWGRVGRWGGGSQRPPGGEQPAVDDAVDTSAALARFRRHVGFVFQIPQFIPHLSIFDNVALPLAIDGVRFEDAEPRVIGALRAVNFLPFEREPSAGERRSLAGDVRRLSGGEKQRVGLARALVRHPAVVLADEPTASLDPSNAKAVLDAIVAVRDRRQLTVVMATHSQDALARCDRVLRIEAGRLVPMRGDEAPCAVGEL